MGLSIAKKDFGTIQNNTALKHSSIANSRCLHFGTIQNNTALKPRASKIPRGFVIAPFVVARLQF